MVTWKSLSLVFAGGTLGTLLRFSFDLMLGSLLSVAAVNIIGSIIIGWVNSDPRTSRVGRKQFWSVGFAGGFTTMSGVALLTASGITTLTVGEPVNFQVASFIVGIFVLSLLGYWGAYSLGQRLAGENARPVEDADEVTQ